MWRTGRIACPVVLGCMPNSCPKRSRDKNTTITTAGSSDLCRTGQTQLETNLSFGLKRVGVQAVYVIEDHVVVERSVGTV